jgi:hypothetical protein
MNKDIDSELDGIVAAHRAVTDAAKQKASDIQAATAAFNRAWEACRIGIVKPTLNEMVSKLSNRGMGATVGDIVGGIAFTVPPPDAPHRARGHEQHPQLLIVGTLGPNRVTIKQSVVGTKEHTYKVDEITKELIQQHAMELVRYAYSASPGRA